ncbi:serine-rich adhesin for platelets-like isoform X2 [Narcine bancroftii]|uniref:serine-rich adhesin for platelets-like isoform X2 n=1 Tax=Narcine bancroftii TaxID=1343680 RepID=UPI003831722A
MISFLCWCGQCDQQYKVIVKQRKSVMESGQDQSDGLQNTKDDLINFSIPMDYAVDGARNQREGLQTSDPLELLPSGTMDTQYSMCSKNTPGDLETNAVPQSDKVHLDDAISSTTVTVSYVNRPHLFSSQRILQHSLHEPPLPSLFIPSVCVQSQQMLSASFDSSVSTNFVDSSFENSVLAQSGDLDSIRSGLENGIDCSTLNQHELKALDLDLPLVATTIRESDSPLDHRSNTTEENLYEQSSASSDVETEDSVCQFSGVMGQENKWSDSEGSTEALVQNSEVLVMKLTASDNRANSNEQCESQNLLGRMDYCEMQNGTEVFTGIKTSSSHHTESTLQPTRNLNINYKDQSTMTIKTENIEFLEAAVPANSEESPSEDNFGKTCPKVLKEDDSPFCDKSKLPSTCMQLSQNLNADNYRRASTESVGTNTASDCKAAPNVYCSDMLQDSEKSIYTSGNLAVLQTDNKSQQSTKTEESLNDQEIALSFDVKNREMHCSGKDSIAIKNDCSVQANCSSADNTISPPSENLVPVSNITVTEQFPNPESNFREPQKQICGNDNILEAEPNLVPESLQKVNNVHENSRNIISFNKQTFPSLAKPSASESNHPRIKPCSLELHKLNVLETEGKGDVRGYVLDLKRNNVASMSCSISMSLSLSKSGKSIGREEEAESTANSDSKGDQTPSNDVCNVLSVQAEQPVPNRRKQNFVAKYEDEEVVCISDDEVVNCSVAKTDAQQDGDRSQVRDTKKRRMPCQQHLNQTFEGRPLQNAEPKHYERKILPPRQRGMRLEQIVQNIVTQPKSKTSHGERPKRNRDGPIPTPTRFQPPRHKSSSSVAEQKSKGCAGSFPCIKGSSQKISLESKMQEQCEANQTQGSSTAVGKLNRDKSTSIPGSCHGRVTKLNTPVSSSKSSCSASTSSKQPSENYWEGHTLGDKHKFSEPDIRCLNGNRRKHSGSSRSVSEPKNCMSSRAQSSQPRTQGTVRKRVHKSAGKKRQSQRGRPSMFFAPEEPEIKLRALSLKAEDRRERYDSFSPYVRVEAKGYSMCTVINYSEEDNNNLKQKKHSQQQSHGAVPKSSCLTLGPIINEATRKSFLVCCLCGLSANAMEQGDLFGPFYPRGYTSTSNQISQLKEVKNEQASSVVTSSSCNSIRNAVNKATGQNQEPRTREGATTRGQKRRSVDCMEDTSKCSESKKAKNEPTLEEWYQPPLVPMDANEYWIHEDCVTWCAGVFLVRGKLYGLLEAISIAQETFCSMCQKTGAALGCYIKGCPLKYHFVCAVNSECSLNEDNFSMKCAKHKDRALKISTKVESR